MLKQTLLAGCYFINSKSDVYEEDILFIIRINFISYATYKIPSNRDQ